MKPEERDLAYLWDMREAGREIVEFTAHVSLQEYESNRMMRRAVERLVELIGEAANHVSPAFRQAHREVAWSLIIGQRNVLAHDYGDVLVERIYKVAADHVPSLVAQLDLLIPDPGGSGAT